MTTHTRTRRGGFTLVELIVAIALIAVLIALSAGAFLKVRNTAQEQSTTSMLTKVDTGFMAGWSAVLDKAAEDHRTNKIPDPIVVYAGGDRDRARVLWSYMMLKNEFPTTFAEARIGVGPVNGYTLPARSVFTQALANAAAPNPFPLVPPTDQPELQSAICLYIALTQSGNRGQVFNLDGVPTAEVDYVFGGTAYKFTVFQDSWGTPIAFSRMAFSAEINNPPFVRSAVNRDKCDPLGKMPPQANPPWDAARVTQFWNGIRANHIVNGGPPAAYPLPAMNWVPTLVSAGPNKSFGSLLGGSSTDDGNDNVLSFRLRQEGNRGD